MNESKKLWAVYQAERKLRGLQSRLTAAERFLAEQDRQLVSIDQQHDSLSSQLRQIEASVKESEDEVTRHRFAHREAPRGDERRADEQGIPGVPCRDQRTQDRAGRAEEEVIGLLEKADAVKAEIERSSENKSERTRVRDVAQQERDTRNEEIKERVKELQAERDQLASEVEPRILADLERLLEERDEDAMAGVEVIDKRRHEINCASCMMSLPIELLSQLLRGKLTNCSNCGCFLHLDEETAAILQPAGSKR